jgi:hypothetical protein
VSRRSVFLPAVADVLSLGSYIWKIHLKVNPASG